MYMTIVMVACLYEGLHLGVVYRSMEQPTLFFGMKAVGEEGYIEPKVVDSARRRAREAEKRRKEKRLEKELAGERLKEADETKSKAAFQRDLRARENLPQMDRREGLKGISIEELLLVDDFDPVYEFEVVGEV